MILIFLLNFSSIFAKKRNDGDSTLLGNVNWYEIQDQTQQVKLFGQPRFNTSCDLESLEAANECEQDLQLIFSECSGNCEDQSCVAKCQRDFYINIDYCPCHSECSAGCKSCNHWTCTHPCDDLANNPETDKCYTKNMNELSECQAACKNDMICVNQCFLALGEKNELCPCGKFCERGCPCLDCESCWDCSISTECTSKDEEKKCMEIANKNQIECLSNCQGDECQTCNKAYQNDVDNCPCRKNCPAGCPCESFDCDSLNEIAESCKDPASNKNYQFCHGEQKTSLIQCVEKCETFDCNLKCTATFEEQLERCPCAPKCPSDCPCESYNCDTIENSQTSVLILYSSNSFAYDQHVLDRDGSSRVLDAFNYERDTQVYKSCSAVMSDKMWIFGGNDFKRQLSSVAQCHLKTEGTMPFDLYRGAANTVEGFNGVQTTLLCFDLSSTKSCHSFNGTNFVTAVSSNHPHSMTSLGKMNEGLIAISGASSGVEVELFANGNWYDQPPFPEEKYLSDYSTATYQNILYVFGGRNRDSKAVTIGKMTDLGLEWSKGPDLLLGRYYHRSILIGNVIYHVGGNGNMKTEKWTIKENEVTKELLNLQVNGYTTYPELFAVKQNYCTFL